MIIVTLFAVAMLLTVGWRSFTKVHAFSKSFEDQWETPAEIKASFGTASIVGSNRVVFKYLWKQSIDYWGFARKVLKMPRDI